MNPKIPKIIKIPQISKKNIFNKFSKNTKFPNHYYFSNFSKLGIPPIYSYQPYIFLSTLYILINPIYSHQPYLAQHEVVPGNRERERARGRPPQY